MRLSVVIVNYNTGTLLKECLASIQDKIAPEFPDGDVETVVVDNGSKDGSENAATGIKGVVLVRSGGNFGFAAGCNIGSDVAKGEHLLFLNPDTKILSSGMSALLDDFKSDPRAGALGCQNFLPDGSVQTTAYRFPGLLQPLLFAFGFANLLAVPRLKGMLAPFLKSLFGQFDPHMERKRVDWVTGAFLLVKRGCWIETGRFDERFFLFCEEIDWCKRSRAKGYDVIFDPTFEITHFVGYSSRDVKPFVLLQKFRSYLMYFEKHHSLFVLVWLKLIFFTAINFRIASARVRGDSKGYETFRYIRRELDL